MNHDVIANAYSIFVPTAAVSLVFTFILMAVSLSNFSRSGPAIQDEVVSNYKIELLTTLFRLAFWCFIIAWYWAVWGGVSYFGLSILLGSESSVVGMLISGILGILFATTGRFVWVLFYSPATISTSFNYSTHRLIHIWKYLTPKCLSAISYVLLGTPLIILAGCVIFLLSISQYDTALFILFVTFTLVTIGGSAIYSPKPKVRKVNTRTKKNIIMVGSDTLRADRVGGGNYHRDLTPFIDEFSKCAAKFNNCFVPCARTAPSVTSLLTGSWPHRHGIRDNFVSDENTKLSIQALPAILKANGWQTSAISDWAGSDLGKIEFGFEAKDLPGDQWNIRFLLRQGPKEIRLFLSLFGHNRWCKKFLPELYYLAGVPLNKQIVNAALHEINRLAASGSSFFLNVFMATTHPPFGAEYPYYNMYSKHDYNGESKFVMSGLDEPEEIIRKQGSSREEFDLDQIIDLYDGCVSNFDDEFARIIKHIDQCGLSENTIVVLYSDHGFEFFEHNTWGQGNSAFGDASAKIPLIIKVPESNNELIINDVVRSIDIAPTLLELVGLTIPEDWDGVSLLPYIRDPDISCNLTAYNETGIWLTRMPGMSDDHLSYPDLFEILEIPDKQTGTMAIKQQFQDITIMAKDRMIQNGKWKLVYQPLNKGSNLLLFDTDSDPFCMHDISSKHQEVFNKLRMHLQCQLDYDLIPGGESKH